MVKIRMDHRHRLRKHQHHILLEISRVSEASLGEGYCNTTISVRNMTSITVLSPVALIMDPPLGFVFKRELLKELELLV